MGWLRSAMKRIGVDLNIHPSRIVDTLELSKVAFAGTHAELNNGALARRYGVELPNAHDALGDAEANALWFEGLRAERGWNTLADVRAAERNFQVVSKLVGGKGVAIQRDYRAVGQ